MKRQIVFVILAALGTATFTACGSKTDANEKNFGAAMNRYFEKHGELCVGPWRWPVDVNKGGGTDREMAALEAAGLVRSDLVVVERKHWITGRDYKEQMLRYELTDTAKSFTRDEEVEDIGLSGDLITVKQTSLCWGNGALDKIVKWEDPKKNGDYQEALVYYTYKINNAADWAKKPEIQKAFPFVRRVLDGVENKEEDSRIIKLTSEGWEVRVLD